MRVGVAVIVVSIAAFLTAAVPATPATVSPPVASLRLLSPPPKLPADYVRGLSRIAPHVGLTPVIAAHRTRLLLRNVTGLPLYAFSGTGGQICLIVWRGVGTCAVMSKKRAVLWGINGGSRKRGQAVVGVVVDGVRAVNVSLGTRHVRAAVRHNAFVVPFRLGQGASEPRTTVAPIFR